jgi:hypothetical protein
MAQEDERLELSYWDVWQGEARPRKDLRNLLMDGDAWGAISKRLGSNGGCPVQSCEDEK